MRIDFKFSNELLFLFVAYVIAIKALTANFAGNICSSKFKGNWTDEL